ncbi:MAG: hypothetical protein COY81_04645 [Candidatus Pacebacteria bacterium CG_4_10_14_0_8_um_filter_43_12]|nr:MAG: hypothetical protein COU66_02735 [Candidatus Pacebacteria bacterium CG10_big_fil_rev_8_21_14_0_10_44_11]PIY79070.1 MAG: hypothetical protein COY81_04645 [Candidatus Pacebacteria bacterium CG_4_10_14_0_8_um_filter_43_12]
MPTPESQSNYPDLNSQVEGQTKPAEALLPHQLVTVAIVSPVNEYLISNNVGEPQWNGAGFSAQRIVYDSDLRSRVEGKYDLVVLIVRKPSLPVSQAERVAREFRGSGIEVMIIDNPIDLGEYKTAIAEIKAKAVAVLQEKKRQTIVVANSYTDTENES